MDQIVNHQDSNKPQNNAVCFKSKETDTFT